MKTITVNPEVGNVLNDIEKITHNATHNSDSNIVILGKYIENSDQSYEKIAQSKGAIYFSMPDGSWGENVSKYDSENMWTINKEFLDNQIKQGKDFVFTVNPRTTTGFYTREEYKHLKENGYNTLIEKEGMWYAIKK